MQKRHAHVSPTLDIMAKKIFSLPEVTAAFIRDILELDVAWRTLRLWKEASPTAWPMRRMTCSPLRWM